MFFKSMTQVSNISWEAAELNQIYFKIIKRWSDFELQTLEEEGTFLLSFSNIRKPAQPRWEAVRSALPPSLISRFRSTPLGAPSSL